MEKDVTNLIERLVLFEERLGVRLENLSAKITERLSSLPPYSRLDVMGELHVHNGMTLNQDTRLVFTIYDDSGRVIGTDHLGCFKKKFYGFEVFDRGFDLEPIRKPVPREKQ
jgi:hypothetical protein